MKEYKITDTENILGLEVVNNQPVELLDALFTGIVAGKKGHVLVCANPHSVVMAKRDERFFSALQSADTVVPDGSGIILASRILGGRIRQRITGFDVFAGLCQRMNDARGMSCFFLGSSQQNLELIREKFSKEYPHVKIAGAFSPPFKSEFHLDDNQAMVETINKARPDVLWVGMSAPKQEKWIQQHRDQLDVKFIGAIGAVFDFYVGTVKRSSTWFLDHGLEWLPRLLQQPRRLWRRMVISAPLFLFDVAKTWASAVMQRR